MLRDVAARADGTRIFLSVYQPGSATTPLTAEARAQFASYVAAIVRDVPEIRDIVVGNEPNLNRFWLPQFDEAGNDVAAPAYFALLVGGVRRRQGGRRGRHDLGRRRWRRAASTGPARAATRTRRRPSSATSARPTGRAAARSRRSTASPSIPIRRARASRPTVRPTPPRSRSCSPTTRRSWRRCWRKRSVAACRSSTASSASRPLIPPAKASLYEGTEPGKPVDEATQADYYRRAIELASCQKDVVGLLLFHSHDEPALTGFQSGVYYVDGTPKTSLEPVRKAIQAAGC